MESERTLQLLLVEDNPTDALLVQGMLKHPGQINFSVRHATTLTEALEQLKNDKMDLILLDLNLPDESQDTLAVVRTAAPETPIVILTANEDDDTAYSALKQGAEDFVVKGSLSPKQLARVLVFAVERCELKKALVARERLRAVFHSIADGIVTINEKGLVQSFNHSAELLFGYKLEEVFGKNVSMLMPEDHAKHHDGYLRNFARTGEYRVIGTERVVEGLKKSGDTFPIALRVTENPSSESEPFIGIIQDITERVAASKELQESQAMLGAIAATQANVLSGKAGSQPFDELLETYLVVTGSEYGFIGAVHIDENSQPYLLTHAITNIAWDATTKAFFDAHVDSGLEFRNLDTLFGAVMRTGEVLLTNDPAAHPASGGLPEGHPPMTAFLGLPLHADGNVVGMVGLANRPDGYDQDLVDKIVPMTNTAVSLLQYNTTQTALEGARFREARVSDELTQLIDTANAPMFGVDASLKVTEWNQMSAKITGYEKDEVLGRDLVADFITENYQASVNEVLKDALAGTERTNYEFPLFTKQGAQVDVLLNATTRRDVDGTIIGVIGIGQDVTEAKKAEAELKIERERLTQRVDERTVDLRLANAELARASHTKDEFLASMSHELRTPLNAILSSTESLEEGIYGEMDLKQHRPVKMIDESGRHLLALINDILDLSKVKAGIITLDLEPVVPEEIAQASLRFIKEYAQKKRLNISTQFDNSIETIHADSRRLKQILVNLLSNAVKFTPEGGKLGLEYVADPERQAVHFTVWDSGIGISREDQQKLFQPFTQLDTGLGREFSGSGLGLALVSQMTELHGGSVSVESPGVGEGARFTASLPLGAPTTFPKDKRPTEDTGAEEEPEAAIEKLDPPLGGAAPLLLLAEDNEANIETMSAYLQAKGYRLIVARNGREAVDHAKEEHPDLILMDVQMPVMDGFEATREIRNIPDLASTPIIAVTALAMEGDRERCLANGANEYLSKPVGLKHLTATIHRLIHRESRP
jgi:PAS domain S-box-containing protein